MTQPVVQMVSELAASPESVWSEIQDPQAVAAETSHGDWPRETERSWSSAFTKRFTHHRTVYKTPSGCQVWDLLTFEPRLRFMGGWTEAAYVTSLRRQHHDLRRRHGRSGTSNSLERLVDRWLADPEGLGAHPPANEDMVLDAFAKAGSRATPDVVRLYRSIGGMDQSDREDWRLWPLAEVVAENSEPTEHGVAFSDYMICCWIYRLKPVTSDTSAVFVDFANGTAPILVASSLAEFFDAYLADAPQLLNSLPSAGSAG
jgi:hypothetical protein